MTGLVWVAWVGLAAGVAGQAPGVHRSMLEEQAQEIARLRGELASLSGESELAEAQALGLLQLLGKSALPPPTARRIAVAIIRESRRHGLDPLLVAAVIHAESTFNPYAVSSAGAMGLMQLMPATARELALKRGAALGPSRNLFDAELNIELGTAYLAMLVGAFGSVESALVAYNAGPSAAKQILANAEVRRRFLAGYPNTVVTELRRLHALKKGPASRSGAFGRPDQG